MIISVARLANYGLMVLSPIILVRLLTVEQFGAYREFLLYAAVASSLAAFNININLLYFVPSRPESTWRFVHQSTILVGAASLLIVGTMVAADLLTGGAVVGRFLVPVALFTLCFVNVDFWEQLWLAEKKATAVWIYTAVRLIARMLVAVIAAALTADVEVIVWSLVALEAARLTASAIAWRVLRKDPGPSWQGSWREQIDASLPLGLSLLLITVTRNAGSFFIAKFLGPAALAQYTIGTFAAPVGIVRNAFSDALLPDMATDHRNTDRIIELWQRTTVVLFIGFLPLAVLLARFGYPIVVSLFSQEYEEAVPVFQIYALVLLRECFDFGVLVRAFNRNSLLISTNALAAAVTIGLLALMVPLFGLIGAVAALAIVRIFDAVYLLWLISRDRKLPIARIVPFRSLMRVIVASAVAAIVLLVPWANYGGVVGSLAGVAVASLLYFATVVFLLYKSRMPEALFLTDWLKGRMRTSRRVA